MGVQSFDGVAVEAASQEIKRHSLCGSVRLTYTLCGFFAMILHLCMRNTIHFSILYMAEETPPNIQSQVNDTSSVLITRDQLTNETNKTVIWDRSQQFTIQGTFYYGFVASLPFGGYLSDRFGGKFFFVHSITAQAVVFMLTPLVAHRSYVMLLLIRFIQGLIGGFGPSAVYQLFTTWAHQTERALLSTIAFAGFSVGSLLAFPLNAYFCEINWKIGFYVVGSISLLFGICCIWLVYNTLEDHPRISKEEYAYLKPSNEEKTKIKTIPWKSIFTSIPVYAFILTHFFHSFGIFLFTTMTPRLLNEGLLIPLTEIGWYSSMLFLGACLAKFIALPLSFYIEKKPNINITIFRKIWYAANMISSIGLLFAVISINSSQWIITIICIFMLGVFLDLGFSLGYWPTLLYLTPSYAGLLSGIANSLATFHGFLCPFIVAAIVETGDKTEWDIVMILIIAMSFTSTVVFGLFSSSKLQNWSKEEPK